MTQTPGNPSPSSHEMGATANPEELLRLARAGSQTALGQLLDSYSRYLTLLARLQLRGRVESKADALDLVQEAFLDAHQQFENFKGTSTAEFLVWLRKILIGKVALLFRKYLGTKGRDVRLEQDLNDQLDQSSKMLDTALLTSLSTPSQHASRREQAMLLANALAQLPKDYHEVIVLRHLEQLQFPEVARRMDRSETSVYKLWMRALASLRATLGSSDEAKGAK